MKVLKRTIALFFALLFLFNLTSAKTLEITANFDEILVKDGEKVGNIKLDVAPYINEKGRTMVSIDFFTENLGIKGEWNKDANEAAFSSEDKTVVLSKESVKVNGETASTDSLIEVKDGNVFVPLRFLGEAFGYNLGYSTVTKKIILDSSEAVLKSGNTVMNYTEFEALFDIFYGFAYDDAVKSGASEEEIKFYAYQAAAETAISFVVMYNAFPGISLDAEDIDFIKGAIEADGKVIDYPLPGIFALIQEKYYFAKGTPILKSLKNSPELQKNYVENYICAKHILVEDVELAKVIIEKIKNGEDFDALIKEYGKDPGAENYPEGYIFAKGEMVEEFEKAAFSLEEGEVSSVVESPYGYHIIKRETLPEMPEYIKDLMVQNKANEILAKAEKATLLMEENILAQKLGLTE